MAFSDYQRDQVGAGLGSFLGGMFGGDAGAPYQDASNQMKKYGNMAVGANQPYLNAGNAAIPQYQNWLQGQQNPSGFINNLMNQYQQSPWASFQQLQGQRAGNNAASASGMLGSTPFMQESQNYAHNIANQDMNQWLQHVLGINTQYGAGQQNMMGMGQTAAGNIGNIYNNMGTNMGEMAYARGAANQNQHYNMLGGAGTLLSMFL